MNPTFFEEITSTHPGGVAYKNLNLKKRLLAHFADQGNATIGELSKALRLSVPKVTSLLNALIEDGLVRDNGKDDSTGGRPPSLYGLTPDSAYFLGIDVKRHHINLGLTDFQKNIVKVRENYPYKLDNTEESLQELCQLIRNFIAGLNIPKEKILGIGINLSGRINYKTGYSYSFFHFQEDPLSKIIESEVGIQVFLENDSRAMTYGEYCAGAVQQEKDVLFLNLDYGIGLGIVIDGHLYYGKSGYSGEFGHIPIFDNDIICHCGKKGCLETEASGWALVQKFKEKIKEGYTTLLAKAEHTPEDIMLEDIIEAAHNDDVLAIELIAETGEKLGRGIAALINIFNPELVVLGGSLSSTEDYIRLPIKSTINKYSLSLMNNDTQVKISALGNRAGLLGACLLVRNRLLAIH
ncbi:MAG: ROK family transcriptional regulator [Phaeodactylibacter sp.]|nr:ROK family transcriptional regulator [Phaeodactylibacter sp.]